MSARQVAALMGGALRPRTRRRARQERTRAWQREWAEWGRERALADIVRTATETVARQEELGASMEPGDLRAVVLAAILGLAEGVLELGLPQEQWRLGEGGIR